MLKNSAEFGYPEFDEKGEKVLVTPDGEYGSMMQDIRVYRMKAGEERTFFDSEMEQAILLVQGDIEYIWVQRHEYARRDDFIHQSLFCLHVCRNSRIVVKARNDSEILVQKTKNDRTFEAVYYTPGDCIDADSCPNLFEGKAHRIVRTAFDYKNAPYSNMVLGEIITQQGGWCSYIPHWHPQPEVYYYRYERPEGFGASFIGDNVYKITDGSFSAITPGETHPVVTAPGYPQYCVWMIRHLPENPWTDRVDDPEYTWLMTEKIVYR